MSAQTLEIYDILKKIVPEQEASKIVNYIEDTKDKEITLAVERKIEHLATKEDLANLKADMADRFKEQIKWMFIFWIGLLLPIIGFLIAVLKK